MYMYMHAYKAYSVITLHRMQTSLALFCVCTGQLAKFCHSNLTIKSCND